MGGLIDRLSVINVELPLAPSLPAVEFVACTLAAINKLPDIVRASTVANIKGMILCVFVTIDTRYWKLTSL